MHRISDEQYDTPQVPDIDHMWVILSSQSRCCYRHSLLDRWALLLWALLLCYCEHCYCYWHSLLDRWAPTLKQCPRDRCSNQTSSQHRHQTIKGNWNLKTLDLILPLFLRIRCLSSYHCNKNSMCTSTIWNFSFISFKKNTLPVYISFPFARHLSNLQAISTQRWTRWSMWWPTMISRQDIMILKTPSEMDLAPWC